MPNLFQSTAEKLKPYRTKNRHRRRRRSWPRWRTWHVTRTMLTIVWQGRMCRHME